MSDGPPALDHEKPFEDMARRIVDNIGRGFAGAFVIVPPSGAVTELLLLSSVADDAIFWSQVKTYSDIALANIQQKQNSAGGWR